MTGLVWTIDQIVEIKPRFQISPAKWACGRCFNDFEKIPKIEKTNFALFIMHALILKLTKFYSLVLKRFTVTASAVVSSVSQSFEGAPSRDLTSSK